MPAAKRGAVNEEERTLAVLTHVLGLIAYFIAPLVILLASNSEYVKKHARNALNWQLSLIIYFIISVVLIIVLIGILLLVALAILNLIFCIIAAVKASEGEVWRYPLSINFLRD